MKLLAIDPGVRCCGWALFVAPEMSTGPRLLRCGLSRSDEEDDLERFHWMVQQMPPCDVQVIERPQLYDRRKSKGDPEDLARLLILCGYIAAQMGDTHLVKPHDWKGTIPKAPISDYIVHRRNEKALGREYMPDSVLASLAHNVADAVGIGIWFLRHKMPRGM